MYQTGQTEGQEKATNESTEQQSRGPEMASDDIATGNLNDYRQSLGACWIVYGIFRVILGICLFVYSGTSTVMFGALLGRVPDPFDLMGAFHVVYAVIVVLSFVCGIVGLLAGLALLAKQRSALKLALVAAILSVSDPPFGTTLGIFTLVAFLPFRGGFASARA